MFPERAECHQNILNRCEWIKEFLRNYLVPEDQKVIVLTHYSMIVHLTGVYDKVPENGIYTTLPDRFMELAN